MKREEKIQSAFSKYLKFQHPKVMFISDSSGLRLPIGLAVIAKNQRNPSTGWNDMFIAEARGGYHGLWIELKKDRNEYLTKQGKLRNNKHIQDQHEVHCRLIEKGYKACFAGGLDEAISVTEEYLNLQG
jgi:hypothetical protein